MHSGRFVFSQVMDHLPMKTFRRCVQRYQGNRHIQSFTCLDQFLCMAFAQLTFRESLRDIEACLRAHQDKLYHMGIRGGMSRNTLANANQRRDWRIYAEFAQAMIRIARPLYADEDLGAGARQHRLRPGCIDHRPVSFGLSVGVVPLHQVRRQAAHVIGPAGQHSDVHSRLRREDARCERPRHPGARARRVLHHGPRVRGLRAVVSPAHRRSSAPSPTRATSAATPIGPTRRPGCVATRRWC